MEIALVGAPNKGKSTFFSAATLASAEIAAYPFTTIKPNQGTAYVRVPCACKKFGVKCNPRNSACEDGTRLVPITLIDVAGLVPGAFEGKGLGNQFLSDLAQARALIQVIDCSGKTDLEGNQADCFDVSKEVGFLPGEIAMWIKGILSKNWGKIARRVEHGQMKLSQAVMDQLAGMRISEPQVELVFSRTTLNLAKPSQWSESDLEELSRQIQKVSKPVVLAANKADLPQSKENIRVLNEKFPKKLIVPVSAESELALRRASKAGVIKYVPGAQDFELLGQANEAQKKALDYIKKAVLDDFKSTGVQKTLECAAFDLLELIVVYPVEDEGKLSDAQGNVLPDVFFLKKGSTVIDLALKVHSDLAENFIGAIDCATKKRIGKDHVLNNGDVIKIIHK
ncbi:MAG: redox-regulated ATPase YchF [Candidatus Diapherotrites archaeon]|nr:redox-regulated ATPase YchF [Candidatus Diapherotrites archaeon]